MHVNQNQEMFSYHEQNCNVNENQNSHINQRNLHF